MTDVAAVRTFIGKWDAVTVNERAVAQSHFNDLCALLGVKPPLEADPKGTFFRFEKPLSKSGGGKGFADVWYKYRFAWEYKTKGKYPDVAPQIYGFLRSKAIGLGATVFAVNGVADHVHMVVAIPPRIAVATFVGQIKGVASAKANKIGLTEAPFYWQEEYGVFSFDGKRHLPRRTASR